VNASAPTCDNRKMTVEDGGKAEEIRQDRSKDFMRFNDRV
jgi:hypothetical protein